MKYQLLTKHGTNDLSQSWTGIEIQSKKRVFIKTPNNDSSVLGTAERKAFLLRSYDLQQRLSSPFLNSAVTQHQEDEKLYIIYPYLEPQLYEKLTLVHLQGDAKNLLSQMAVIIDVLHNHQLIHGDIKIDNFLINTKTKKLVLIDFDFLHASGAVPKGLIFGTQAHIFQSLVRNEELTNHIDYYAFQIIVEQVIPSTQPVSTPTAFTHYTTTLDILIDKKIISQENYCIAQKRILKLYLLRCWKNLNSRKKNILNLLTISHRILGLQSELLQTLFNKQWTTQRFHFKLLLQLLDVATINKTGDYWVCKLDEEDQANLLSWLAQQVEIDQLVAWCKKQKYHYVLYLLSVKNLYLPLKDVIPGETLEQRLALASAYNNSTLVLKYLKQYSNQELLASAFLRREYIALLLKLHHFDQAAAFLATMSAASLQVEKNNFTAMMHILQGDIKKAHTLLTTTQKQNTDKANAFAALQTKYYLLIVNRYQGYIEEAMTIAESMLAVAPNNDTESLFVSACSVLSFLYYLTGRYQKAHTVAQQGLKNITCMEAMDKQTDLYNVLFYANLRLGKYSKAQTYLYKYLEYGLSGNDAIKLSLYHLALCNYFLNTGNLWEAMNMAQSSLTQVESHHRINTESFDQVLMESSLATGKQIVFQQIKRRYESQTQLKAKQRTQLEIDALTMEYHFCYDNFKPAQEVLALIQELLKIQAVYNAARLVFLSLLESFRAKNKAVITAQELAGIPNKESPLFAIVTKMFHHYHEHNPRNEDIILLKSLLPTLRELHLDFYFGLVLKTIGIIYKELKNNKLARKYLECAHETFALLNNVYFEKQVLHHLQTFPYEDNDNNYLEVYEKVSQLLVSVDDLYSCTREIITFALHETGAERAVLLVKNQDTNELRIKDSMYCDRLSLKDIESLSHSLIQRSFNYQEPLIIDNAIEDNRFSSYKSIIVHNIQSVLSIPLVKNDHVIGVLYLDHHTLPALFNRQDISFAKTISNVLAHILTTSSTLHMYRSKSEELSHEFKHTLEGHQFITQDPSMQNMLSLIPQYAKSNAPVLLLGESGTGKEIVAHLFHKYSKRSNQQFIKVNASAIPDKLIESELFGIADKVATEVKAKIGKFEYADGGTLFLDEIGDMPLHIQAKILRAVENQEFERVGSNRIIRTDIRFIYATNRDLKQMVANKDFRDDLYQRIKTIPIHITSLRERKADIPLLIEHFISLYNEQTDLPVISPEVFLLFEKYHWPGNVRELKNIIERLSLLFSGRTITLKNLPPDIKDELAYTQTTSDEILKQRMQEVLLKHNYNITRAAKELTIPLSTFRRKMKLFNLM